MSEWQTDLLQKARQWIAYADEDLRLAEYALGMSSSTPYRLIAYHAQQCAEKYLKAFLVLSEVDFPFTHNISLLLERCSEISDWPQTLEGAEELTAYAVTARYPGEAEIVTRHEALRAIDLAKSVKDTIVAALDERGLA